VIVEPGATMYDQHPGSRAVLIVGDEESTELRIPIVVLDAFFSQAHTHLLR
jgi:hypothetical protein